MKFFNYWKPQFLAQINKVKRKYSTVIQIWPCKMFFSTRMENNYNMYICGLCVLLRKGEYAYF